MVTTICIAQNIVPKELRIGQAVEVQKWIEGNSGLNLDSIVVKTTIDSLIKKGQYFTFRIRMPDTKFVNVACRKNWSCVATFGQPKFYLDKNGLIDQLTMHIFPLVDVMLDSEWDNKKRTLKIGAYTLIDSDELRGFYIRLP